MKSIVTIISILLLVRPVLPVADYILNYGYISKVLCENREKPRLGCNGKCHLMKELAKAADSETLGTKPIPPGKKAQLPEAETLYFQEITPLIGSQPYFQGKGAVTDHYSNFYFPPDGCTIYHPPSFLA